MLTALSQTRLPHHFAEKVLELESLFEDDCSIDIITKLNQLYRVAIDHYIQNDVKKANYFQKKMIKLFNDPLTLSLIQNKESPPQKLRQIAQRSKMEEEITRFQLHSDNYVKVILQQSEKALKKNEALKAQDLNKQEQNLQNRILLKKCRSQQKMLLLNQSVVSK